MTNAPLMVKQGESYAEAVERVASDIHAKHRTARELADRLGALKPADHE